ncbi:hypothetical protein Bbelb_018350 [Branchiostoma belcheri]|nr:hypothetical protein Bbelb_018350 [Branchiostoma belcheri]
MRFLCVNGSRTFRSEEPSSSADDFKPYTEQDVPETPSGKTSRASFSSVCYCGDHQATDRTPHAHAWMVQQQYKIMAAISAPADDIGEENPVLRLVQAQFMAKVQHKSTYMKGNRGKREAEAKKE